MPWVTKDFDKYRMQIISGHQIQAEINPLNADGTNMARILFVKDDAPLLINTMTATQIHLSFPVSRLNDIVNMLRYETPLSLHYNTDTRVGKLTTRHAELVGEQEL